MAPRANEIPVIVNVLANLLPQVIEGPLKSKIEIKINNLTLITSKITLAIGHKKYYSASQLIKTEMFNLCCQEIQG